MPWAVAGILLVLVGVQEMRWQLHDPFRLVGISHLVGVPPRVPLTAGYAVRNTSPFPLRIVGLELTTDERRTVTQTFRLDVLELVALRGIPDGEVVPAEPGTILERGLRASRVDGARVPSGTAIELGATFVGTGPGRYHVGPLEVAYRLGPIRMTQRVPFSRGYVVRVTEPDGGSPPFAEDE